MEKALIALALAIVMGYTKAAEILQGAGPKVGGGGWGGHSITLSCKLLSPG